MARHALLIGVSEYGEGFDPLPGSLHDIRQMEEVLSNPQVGSFDHVKAVENPARLELEEEIERFFLNKDSDDLLLFYFSGHGDLGFDRHQPHLHFCTSGSYKQDDRLFETSAMSADTLKRRMDNSDAQQIIVILDCCHSSSITQFIRKGRSEENLVRELKAPGRTILTSSGRNQVSFQHTDGLSVYTSYLIEGIEGKAQVKNKSYITVQDLHQYVKRRIKDYYIESDLKKLGFREPKPDILVVGSEGYNIVVAQVIDAYTSASQFSSSSSTVGNDQVSKGGAYAFSSNGYAYESSYSDFTSGCSAIVMALVGMIFLFAVIGTSQSQKQYVIQPGDNLTKIARTQLGDASHVNDLLSANPGLNISATLMPGESINIPSISHSSTQTFRHSDVETPGNYSDKPIFNATPAERLDLWKLDENKSNTAFIYKTIDKPEKFEVIARKSEMSFIHIPGAGKYWVLNSDIDESVW